MDVFVPESYEVIPLESGDSYCENCANGNEVHSMTGITRFRGMCEFAQKIKSSGLKIRYKTVSDLNKRGHCAYFLRLPDNQR